MDQVNRKRRRRQKRGLSRQWSGISRQESPAHRWCQIAGDLSILAILFLAPLIMGGRSAVGKLVYLVLVGVLTVAWLVRQSLTENARYRPTGIGWILGAAIALVVFQIVPLPTSFVQFLSPFQSQLLTTWTETATPVSFGSWNQLSLAPISTREGINTLVVHVTLFLVAVQWLRDWEQVERLLRWIALAAISMAALGFLQYLSHTDKFAWVFVHPSRDASRVLCGPFANSNHFGHFLTLGIGPVLWWLHQSLPSRRAATSPKPIFGAQRPRQMATPTHLALSTALALMAVSGLLTQSRGAMLVMFMTAALAVGLFAITRLFHAKSLAAVVVAGLIVAVALNIHGKEEIRDELSTMTSLESIDKDESRRNVWRANLAAAKKFSICGTGVGSHDEVYRRFFPHPSELEYTHAESGFLQVLTETGLPGMGLVLLCIGACSRWLWTLTRRVKAPNQMAAVIALTVGLVASAVHSVFDFVWFIPACMSLTVLIAAVTCRATQIVLAAEETGGVSRDIMTNTPIEDHRPATASRRTFRREAWLATAAAAAAFYLVLGSWQWPFASASVSWNRYLRLSLAKTAPPTLADEQNESVSQRQARLELERKNEAFKFRQMVRELETTLHRLPQHPRANIRLAGFRIRMFEQAQESSDNAMGLAQIRDAAYASLETDPDAVDQWLTVALGENRRLIEQAWHHARTGVMNSPLLGRGYIYLSQLAFLEGVGPAAEEQLVTQAYLVRPYDGNVWLTISENALLAGDIHKAFTFRRRAFHQDIECRDAIINGLAGQMQATAFLQQFSPDEQGLRALLRFYTRHDQPDNARVVAAFLGDHMVERAQSAEGEVAANYWVRATLLYRLTGDSKQSLKCAETAARAAPNSLRTRRMYAVELFRNQKWSQAVPELRWCYNRRPTDKHVKQMLATAARTSQMQKTTSR